MRFVPVDLFTIGRRSINFFKICTRDGVDLRPYIIKVLIHYYLEREKISK